MTDDENALLLRMLELLKGCGDRPLSITCEVVQVHPEGWGARVIMDTGGSDLPYYKYETACTPAEAVDALLCSLSKHVG